MAAQFTNDLCCSKHTHPVGTDFLVTKYYNMNFFLFIFFCKKCLEMMEN